MSCTRHKNTFRSKAVVGLEAKVENRGIGVGREEGDRDCHLDGGHAGRKIRVHASQRTRTGKADGPV
jgi:hypothetical protein